MIQSSATFHRSEDGFLSIDDLEELSEVEFDVRRFLFFNRVRLGELKGVAYEPLTGFLFSIFFRVFGGWILDSGIRRYHMIRIPNHGRIELFISDLGTSTPHARFFAYSECDLVPLKRLAVRYANFLNKS